jgi:hypothetical protein
MDAKGFKSQGTVCLCLALQILFGQMVFAQSPTSWEEAEATQKAPLESNVSSLPQRQAVYPFPSPGGSVEWQAKTPSTSTTSSRVDCRTIPKLVGEYQKNARSGGRSSWSDAWELLMEKHSLGEPPRPWCKDLSDSPAYICPSSNQFLIACDGRFPWGGNCPDGMHCSSYNVCVSGNETGTMPSDRVLCDRYHQCLDPFKVCDGIFCRDSSNGSACRSNRDCPANAECRRPNVDNEEPSPGYPFIGICRQESMPNECISDSECGWGNYCDGDSLKCKKRGRVTDPCESRGELRDRGVNSTCLPPLRCVSGSCTNLPLVLNEGDRCVPASPHYEDPDYSLDAYCDKGLVCGHDNRCRRMIGPSDIYLCNEEASTTPCRQRCESLCYSGTCILIRVPAEDPDGEQRRHYLCRAIELDGECSPPSAPYTRRRGCARGQYCVPDNWQSDPYYPSNRWRCTTIPGLPPQSTGR